MHRRHVTSAIAALLAAPLLAAPVTAAEPSGPDPVDRGSWSVTPAGPDTWQVSWTSPEPLRVGGDHPRIRTDAGTDLGTTTISEGGRTVGVTVVATRRPRPADLDVVLSGRTLDEVTEPAGTRTAPGPARFAAPEQDLLPVDPGTPGDIPVVTDDYTLAPIQVDGMATPVEMVGHVVKPAPAAAEADDPLVLVLHGRHGSCFVGDKIPSYTWPCKGAQQPVPNHLGYEYVQELLASQGFVTVSISANAISAQDTVPDLGTAARSELVQAHLDQWAEWADDGEETVDLGNVVLVGHSRGGEGVARASMEIPLDAAYRVTGQVLLAPTDFSRQTSPYVPTVTVLPYCDGDVFDLMGQSFTDRSRDLTTDDTSIKSSVLVMGANHNFFNTEWTPGLSTAFAEDDFRETGPGACAAGSESRLTAGEQRDAGKAYVAGAVRLFAEAEDDFLPMYDGSAVRVGSAGDAVVLSHLLGGGRVVRRPGIDSTPTDSATATVRLCTGATPWENSGKTCGRYARNYGLTPHWPAVDEKSPVVKALQMRWTAAGAVGGLALFEPLDLTGASALDLRTIVDPRVGDVDLEVRVTDADGATAQAPGVTGETLAALPKQAKSGGRYWAQTLRVDPAELDGVDLARLSEVELVGLSDTGRVWLLDVSAVPPSPAAVPVKRMPLVDLGAVTVDEGPTGTQLAQLPFDVLGDLESDAEMRVYEAAFDPHERSSGAVAEDGRLVVIPAGTDSGTIAWEYGGDELDSVTPRVIEVLGHGVEEVLTRDYHGRIEIVDDDPSPRMRFRSPDDVVAEGGTTTWVVRLKDPSKQPVQVGLKAVAGDGSPVQADDLTRSWLRSYVFVPPGTNPLLHETVMNMWGFVDDENPKAVFEVPVRDDDRKEGEETLTFRAVTNTGWKSRPVTVTIPAGR